MYYILLFDCKLNSLKSLCSFDYSISMLRKHWLFIWSSWVENLKARRLRTVNSIAHIKQVCLDSIFKQNNNNNGFLSRMFESSLLSIISCFLLANLSQTSGKSRSLFPRSFWEASRFQIHGFLASKTSHVPVNKHKFEDLLSKPKQWCRSSCRRMGDQLWKVKGVLSSWHTEL